MLKKTGSYHMIKNKDPLLYLASVELKTKPYLQPVLYSLKFRSRYNSLFTAPIAVNGCTASVSKLHVCTDAGSF